MNTFDGRPVEILLVEDNPGDVLLTREAFSRAHIRNEINVARDGDEALDFLHKRGDYKSAPRPDLILLDLNLPKTNGQEVLSHIKQDPDLKRIPVVVLTSSEAEKDMLKSYNLHANGYVVKPFDLNRFSEVVSAIEGFWFVVAVYPE